MGGGHGAPAGGYGGAAGGYNGGGAGGYGGQPGAFAGAGQGGGNSGMTPCQGDVWSLLKSDTVGDKGFSVDEVRCAGGLSGGLAGCKCWAAGVGLGCRRWAAGGEPAPLPCLAPCQDQPLTGACMRPAHPRHADLPGAGRPLPAAAGAGGGGLAGQRGALLHHSGRLPLQGRRVMGGVARGRRGSDEGDWCLMWPGRRLGV
jgi:hypothetical protein